MAGTLGEFLCIYKATFGGQRSRCNHAPFGHDVVTKALGARVLVVGRLQVINLVVRAPENYYFALCHTLLFQVGRHLLDRVRLFKFASMYNPASFTELAGDRLLPVRKIPRKGGKNPGAQL